MSTIDKRKEEKMLRDYEKLIYKLANKNFLRYNKKYAFETQEILDKEIDATYLTV